MAAPAGTRAPPALSSISAPRHPTKFQGLRAFKVFRNIRIGGGQFSQSTFRIDRHHCVHHAIDRAKRGERKHHSPPAPRRFNHLCGIDSVLNVYKISHPLRRIRNFPGLISLKTNKDQAGTSKDRLIPFRKFEFVNHQVFNYQYINFY